MSQSEIKAFFDQLDKNSSGFLEHNEIPGLLKEIGLEGVTVEEILKVVDENKDGKISFSEFCKLVKS